MILFSGYVCRRKMVARRRRDRCLSITGIARLLHRCGQSCVHSVGISGELFLILGLPLTQRSTAHRLVCPGRFLSPRPDYAGLVPHRYQRSNHMVTVPESPLFDRRRRCKCALRLLSAAVSAVDPFDHWLSVDPCDGAGRLKWKTRTTA